MSVRIFIGALALIFSFLSTASAQIVEDTLVGAPVKRAVPNAPDLRLTPQDGNVRKGLNRWMKTLGYQDVAWQLTRDIPIERDLTFSGSVDEILAALAETQTNTPRAMRFCIHTNKVVRAIPITQFCKDAS